MQKSLLFLTLPEIPVKEFWLFDYDVDMCVYVHQWIL